MKKRLNSSDNNYAMENIFLRTLYQNTTNIRFRKSKKISYPMQLLTNRQQLYCWWQLHRINMFVYTSFDAYVRHHLCVYAYVYVGCVYMRICSNLMHVYTCCLRCLKNMWNNVNPKWAYETLLLVSCCKRLSMRYKNS